MAETPQMEVPMASSEPSLPDNPNRQAADENDRAGQGHVHHDLHQRDAAEFDDIAENETHSERDNPDLQPEFVRLDTSAEDAVQADGVGDDKADDNRPQHILDVRHCPMLVVCKRIPPHLRVLTEQADRDQQHDARHVRQQVSDW